MARFVIIGVIVAVAFILYALVDAAMSDASRARGVSKPVWVVIIVVLPIIGGVLWFVIGRGRGPVQAAARAPDDDPSFTGRRLSTAEIDAHVEELEARLRELDAETFPGVDDTTTSADESTAPASRAETRGDATEVAGSANTGSANTGNVNHSGDGTPSNEAQRKPGDSQGPDSSSSGEAR